MKLHHPSPKLCVMFIHDHSPQNMILSACVSWFPGQACACTTAVQAQAWVQMLVCVPWLFFCLLVFFSVLKHLLKSLLFPRHVWSLLVSTTLSNFVFCVDRRASFGQSPPVTPPSVASRAPPWLSNVRCSGRRVGFVENTARRHRRGRRSEVTVVQP